MSGGRDPVGPVRPCSPPGPGSLLAGPHPCLCQPGAPSCHPTPSLHLFSLPSAGQSLCSPPFPLPFPRLQAQISEDNLTLPLEETQSSPDP